MTTTTIIVGVAGTVALLVAILLRRTIVIAQPDEWLLCIRNGAPLVAGVGIRLLRRPGDVVARFTSTVQRIRFVGEVLSSDRIEMRIEGFILWSVSSASAKCFRAFQKLGIVNLNTPPADLVSRQHLLSTPQHRAFRQLLIATLQRLASTISMDGLMGEQDELVSEFRDRLSAVQEELGIEIQQVEIVKVSPMEKSLVSDLSAEIKERIKDEAARARLQSAEQVKRREIDSEERIAKEEAEIEKQKLEREHDLMLERVNNEREITLREAEASSEVQKASLERAEMELQAHLDRIKREAETERIAIEAVAAAHESKSPALREWELSKLNTEKTAEAIAHLPLRDARWITIGDDSPMASISGIIAAAKGLVSTDSTRVDLETPSVQTQAPAEPGAC